MGQEPCGVTQMLNFLVIKVGISYNALLGRPRINTFQAVASTYHIKTKFPTKNDIGNGKSSPLMIWTLEKMKKGRENQPRT